MFRGFRLKLKNNAAMCNLFLVIFTVQKELKYLKSYIIASVFIEFRYLVFIIN